MLKMLNTILDKIDKPCANPVWDGKIAQVECAESRDANKTNLQRMFDEYLVDGYYAGLEAEIEYNRSIMDLTRAEMHRQYLFRAPMEVVDFVVDTVEAGICIVGLAATVGFFYILVVLTT